MFQVQPFIQDLEIYRQAFPPQKKLSPIIWAAMCEKSFYPPEEKFFDTRLNIFFLCACSLGIFNNTFVLFILYKFQQSAHLILLKSLAVTDLCLSFSFIFLPIIAITDFKVPFNTWGDIFCRVYISSFITSFLGVASALHVVMLALEFYGGSSTTTTTWYEIFFRSKLRVRLIVTVIWFVSIYTAIVTPIITQKDDNQCCFSNKLNKLRIAFVAQDAIFVFLLPFFVIFYCYISISLHVRQAINFYNIKKEIDSQALNDLKLVQKFQRTLTIRISCLFLLYIVVWLPTHIVKICHVLKIWGLHDDATFFKYHFVATDILPMLTARDYQKNLFLASKILICKNFFPFSIYQEKLLGQFNCLIVTNGKNQDYNQ